MITLFIWLNRFERDDNEAIKRYLNLNHFGFVLPVRMYSVRNGLISIKYSNAHFRLVAMATSIL